jgi:2-methylisocitrate lyase-like PEP mutase family enzyme
MTTSSDKACRLAELIARPGLLVMPGVYDPVSARLAQESGFAALQCSGLAIAASHLGVADYSIASLPEMVEHTGRIARAVDIPVMGDGDTGFGNAVNAYLAVQAFERCGAAGVNIEDQVMPKRCGHLGGKQITDFDEAVTKVRAAADARRNPDFVINARTDAVAVEGIDSAIRRGNAYLEVGATMVFVEGIASREDIRAAVRGINGPVGINIVEGGKSPERLTFTELQELGVARVSLPGVVFAAAVRGILDVLQQVRDDDGTFNLGDRTVDFAKIHELSGTPAIEALEDRYLAALAEREPTR